MKYSGKSLRQFGTGIIDILNKNDKPNDALEEDFNVEIDTGKKTVVLDL